MAFLVLIAAFCSGQDFVVGEGTVTFLSEAPLERIEARSDQLAGVIRASDRTFAFAIPMETFEGFNSPLQRVHFNENYMESEKYPRGSFSGRIIEDIDLLEKGNHEVRVKGDLMIHGISREKIFHAQISRLENELIISSVFEVRLEEFGIRVPRVVHQKISQIILVDINASLKSRE